jgi:hypothetical protein
MPNSTLVEAKELVAAAAKERGRVWPTWRRNSNLRKQPFGNTQEAAMVEAVLVSERRAKHRSQRGHQILLLSHTCVAPAAVAKELGRVRLWHRSNSNQKQQSGSTQAALMVEAGVARVARVAALERSTVRPSEQRRRNQKVRTSNKGRLKHHIIPHGRPISGINTGWTRRLHLTVHYSSRTASVQTQRGKRINSGMSEYTHATRIGCCAVFFTGSLDSLFCFVV